MAGISEVARLAGVSTATVSRALSGNGSVSALTRDKVERAAAELDYVVSSTASGLASGRTRNIGVVMPFVNRWYFGEVLEGAQAALRRRGYDLTLYSLSSSPDIRSSLFDDFLLRKRVDAVLAICVKLAPHEIGTLLGLGKPVVGVGGPMDGVPTLSIDDVEVARLATEHLLGLGHTRIALISDTDEPETNFHIASDRFRGYQLAMADAGARADPALFRRADFTVAGGHAAARDLLAAPSRPTAIFAASDEMAIGAMLAARDAGLSVPRDLSVVGVDDHELAGFFGLSTVAQFPRRQGERAAERILDGLTPGRTDGGLDVRVPVQLVTRTSTAPPADAGVRAAPHGSGSSSGSAATP
ncbi:LacI family DNA-binding transcriptional regulator [Planctomonas psychrotolerans]|uniref:LacI family DNA-binding transcriptional regulator n=1 Tax=Planctomonas psychrotolerans TaxID=2528712 RepID=UPI0012398360|nr:LacI family DNA-binding transcriptional regulator [Planctomonas psychrotolerans]